MNRFLMRLYPYAKVVDDSIASGLFTIWTMLVDMLSSTFTVNIWYLQLTLKPGRVAWKCLIISAELTNRLANSALNSIFLQKYNMVTTFNLIECNLQLRLGKSIVVSQYCNTSTLMLLLDFLIFQEQLHKPLLHFVSLLHFPLSTVKLFLLNNL